MRLVGLSDVLFDEVDTAAISRYMAADRGPGIGGGT
jgi:hypothetical protein